jgi:hypothetical protein
MALEPQSIATCLQSFAAFKDSILLSHRLLKREPQEKRTNSKITEKLHDFIKSRIEKKNHKATKTTQNYQ